MKLNELKNVLKMYVDYTDNEIDCLIYLDIESIKEKYLKQINVLGINANFITCDFANFIKQHKMLVSTYIKNNYSKETAKEMIYYIYSPENQNYKLDGGEYLYQFINYDLESFLTE